MSEPAIYLSAEEVHVASQQAARWDQALHRAEGGEIIPIIAHGEHVADLVPSGELDRLRETIEILSDNDLMHDLVEGLADIQGGRVFSSADIASDLVARQRQGD